MEKLGRVRKGQNKNSLTVKKNNKWKIKKRKKNRKKERKKERKYPANKRVILMRKIPVL